MEARQRRDPAGFEAKRRQILEAATRVFAKTGYEGSRVGDIAQEAGIAYGLIYHYFENKEDILNSLFKGAWGISLKVIEEIAAGDGSLSDKLSSIAGFFLEAWRLQPHTVEVVMLEVIRSPKFMEADNLQAFQGIFSAVERILTDHREELREEVNLRLAAVLFVGSLEILLTGFVAREFLAVDGFQAESSREALVRTFLMGVVQPD